MRFLIDAQLPPALARVLTERGHLAEHVTDIGPGDVSDAVLWQYALDHDAVIVSKDEDFVDLASVRSPAPVIVWVRRGNTTRRDLLAWFAPLIDSLTDLVAAGNRVVELR